MSGAGFEPLPTPEVGWTDAASWCTFVAPMATSSLTHMPAFPLTSSTAAAWGDVKAVIGTNGDQQPRES